MQNGLTQLVAKAAACVATLAGVGYAAKAETPTWSRMAEEDLLAARALILNNHPGAVAEVGDLNFQRQMSSGFQDALSLARTAGTFGGYRAALQRFAAAFHDPHISTAPLVEADRSWPGFLVAVRNGRWTAVARASDGVPPEGSTLLSCDGQDPEELARIRLAPFHGDWSVRAERIRMSWSLLQDRGNPAHPRLKSCEFDTPIGRQSYKLDWRFVTSAEISRRIAAAAPRPSREVWLRPFEQGWWIRLGSSGRSAAPLLSRARDLKEELRAAPFVILDLRGNDGGASFFTDELAKLIYGGEAVDEARRPAAVRDPETIVWRASPDALRTLDFYIQRTSGLLPHSHPLALGLMAQREAVQRALAGGQPLARAPAELGGAGTSDRTAVAGGPPRVIVVTDRYCFSSCVLGVYLFRKLGALHVGEETSANTRYSDLRTIELPSGLSNFSTLQSYSTYLPREIGPFVPAVPLEGDLADDAAVQVRLNAVLRNPWSDEAG